jgi:hypothetical protein
MPPRHICQPPPHELSWLYVPRHRASLHQLREIIDERDQRRLEKFRHHIRTHNIPYCRASHQVYVLSPYSRQYFCTSLRSLLTFDYALRKVKIPVHHCSFCPEVTHHNQRSFEYVIAISRSRGRPRQDTIPPVSSTEESDSELDSDDSDSPTDDDSSDTRTSTHNKSPPPLPESPPSQNHAPTTRRNVPSLP